LISAKEISFEMNIKPMQKSLKVDAF